MTFQGLYSFHILPQIPSLLLPSLVFNPLPAFLPPQFLPSQPTQPNSRATQQALKILIHRIRNGLPRSNPYHPRQYPLIKRAHPFLPKQIPCNGHSVRKATLPRSEGVALDACLCGRISLGRRETQLPAKAQAGERRRFAKREENTRAARESARCGAPLMKTRRVRVGMGIGAGEDVRDVEGSGRTWTEGSRQNGERAEKAERTQSINRRIRNRAHRTGDKTDHGGLVGR